MSLIIVKDLHKVYNEGKHNECRAINGVSFCVEESEMLAITGKSGSGKTTLIRLIAGLQSATSGSVVVNNIYIENLNAKKQAEYRNRTIGIVFQDYYLIDEISVLDNVLLPSPSNEIKTYKEKAKLLLNEMGLSAKIKENTANLSGGEKQRVAIARALINSPKILLADEPTGNLDAKSRNEIIDLLVKLNKEGMTIILITHDNEIAKRCSRIITLNDGKIIEDNTVNV